VGPGETYEVPWNGKTFAQSAGGCSKCQCQEASGAQGKYQATVSAWDAYTCESPGCKPDAEGVVEGATGSGTMSTQRVSFSVPAAVDAITLELKAAP
jgi:hypothetical protein